MSNDTAHATGSASRIAILDPRGDSQTTSTAGPRTATGGASPRLTSLDDKKVGIVIDGPWRSWYLFSEVLERKLQDQGVATERLSVNRLDINEDDLDLASVHVDLDDSAIERFAREIDAVVVGLGN